MITKIDPPDFGNSSTVQVDSDADNPWLAMEEIESWAIEKGFVLTSEFHPRAILIDGHRRFRAICYRISDEERAAMEFAHRQMIERGDRLRGFVSYSNKGSE
jgi:hypothetical protein